MLSSKKISLKIKLLGYIGDIYHNLLSLCKLNEFNENINKNSDKIKSQLLDIKNTFDGFYQTTLSKKSDFVDNNCDPQQVSSLLHDNLKDGSNKQFKKRYRNNPNTAWNS